MKQVISTAVVLMAISVGASEASSGELEALGAALFNDPNLSINRSQSCASCHRPESAFADNTGVTELKGAVSPGAVDGQKGVRNAPTLGYVGLTPTFRKSEAGYVGGFFHDGRARSLEDQAILPILNPAEMGMKNPESVADRVSENEYYIQTIADHLKTTKADLQTPEVIEIVKASLAAFQRSPTFSSFDSKYDRYLRGEYHMNAEEELGMTLFFSEQFTNCNQCHQLRESQTNLTETFTDYTYHNIGVPQNALLLTNTDSEATRDLGLFQNSEVDDSNEAGKFKVPTLRNVAVTGPYMHNGVFQDLETVVLFYNKYNSRSALAKINPETGDDWGLPEVPDNLSVEKLEHGPALDQRRVNALVAFMKTLTDQRYEHLLLE